MVTSQIMGEPDKADLQAELEHAGWGVERSAGDDWWVHESWKLTSTWRPVGASVFVTLLVDPQSATNDVSRVWAIAISSQRPVDWLEASGRAIRVSPRWPTRLKEIVAAAKALRPAA